jgi:penicillin-binding protein 1A
LKPGPTKQKNAVDESSSDALHKRQVKAALSPQTAYVMTSLLQGGVRQGTGARVANYVKRKDLAGKTGTTNRAADTWFIGFNPEFTTGVWVGYDEKRPLGGREEGSRAALPIWGYYMKEVLQNKPERDFPVPPEITFKDMATFVGTPSTGYSAKTVREPVYTPFVGKTLELSPLDTPQTLAQYRGIVIPYVQQDNSAQYQTPVAVPATPVGTGPTPQQVVPAAPTYGPGISPDRHSYTTHPAAIPASAKTKSNLVPIQSINDPVTPKSPSGKEVSENTAVRKSRPNNPKDPTPKTPMPKARP